MLIFVNTECLVNHADDGHGGLPGFEAVLHAWPQLRVVLADERRHWTTIERLRAPFSAPLHARILGTTPIYGALAQSRPGREDEILDWLRQADAEEADWLAVDDRSDEFHAHAHRLLPCRRFGAAEADELHARLQRRSLRREAVVRSIVPLRPAASLGA
ncbi:HAD domain-containing protein [Rubrivivax gelatinosus]|uniref:Uncharacterized protein n=1 Tax=Rubrivivax gelatinosus TaxID=28068 RepID=A0A4R2MQI4_RUBGE|nr:HAD domain-containing protein [Rubrivivax gelatinosus]MBK1688920.1 hypothetical protein [Rubrivivax gelatinosus]TCP05416.1 hypothetical protein EV684_101288 [Rubrivivax gelatinosus]